MYKPKTFLENGFPLEELQHLALTEGNSKRPIYKIHKWWARRLGSVFRTLVMSSFLPPHEKYNDFWAKYYNGFSQDDKIIYDPMMGGGTSLIEGLKLGCKVIGCDINPVAWFVTKKEIEEFDENVVDTYYHNIEQKVGPKIRKLFETSCLNDHKCESIYHLWIRRIECKNCKNKFDLFSNLVIRHNEDGDVIICPKCDGVFHTKQKGKIIKCNLCKSSFDKYLKTVDNGIYSCPECVTKEKVVDNIKRVGQPLPTRIFCIEYFCDKCGRGFKSPAKKDLKLYENTRKAFLKNKSSILFPKQEIPDDNKYDRRPITHGFRYFYELFNPRQLLSLSMILNEIKKIPNQNAKEFLLLTFSSALETNNVLCKYETNWGKIGALFSMPSYHVPERYAENNPLGIGRGSFPRTYLKLKRGKSYAQNAYEMVHKNRTKKSRNERKFTGESIMADRAELYCRDSGNMRKVKSKSVDAVVTDPPYFDTIHYSRLADFFYVWLRLVLKNQYKWFEPETSRRTKEVRGPSDSREDFVFGLTRILKECHRVLKDEGLLVFTFHHTQKWAWSGLRKTLNDSGFHVTATPIMRSEGRTGFRKGSNTSYDVCVVCRKSEKYQHVNHERSLHLRNYLQEIKPLKTIGDPLRVSDIFTVVMSKYLSVGDSAAEKIMKDSSLLVAKIQRKTGIKNSS